MKFIKEGVDDAIAFGFLVATALVKLAAISNALDGLLIIVYRYFLRLLIHFQRKIVMLQLHLCYQRPF